MTLYHVATGNLPFRPFGGRRNKETMFYITTKKASGVICGTQTSENGPIDWSRELPPYCQLSTGLKKIVTPLLAGLLEVDPQRIWSFDRFFAEVQDTLCRKPVYIFNMHRASLIRVYLHPDEKLVAFQAHLQDQTEIPPHAQIILLRDVYLTRLIEESTPGKGYPQTTEENPLMLFSRENNNVLIPSEMELPKFPVFATLVSVENDASQAKVACSVGHACKRRVDKIAKSSKLSQDAVEAFIGLLTAELNHVLEKCQRLKQVTKSVEDYVMAMDMGDNLIRQVLKHFASPVAYESKSCRKELEAKSKELLAELAPAVTQLHQRLV